MTWRSYTVELLPSPTDHGPISFSYFLFQCGVFFHAPLFHEVVLFSTFPGVILLWVMYAALCISCSASTNQHLRESRVLWACPLAHRWCVCRVAWCPVASPTPLQQRKETLQPAIYSALHFCLLFACVLSACVRLSLHWMWICSISLTSAIASRSSSANFLSSSPLGEQKLTSCFFSEVNGLSMVTPWA